MTEIIGFRGSGWDAPFWVSPNRAAYRYNEAGTGPTQYWCLHPLGPWAEYLRAQDLRTPSEIAEVHLRIWVARFHIEEMWELTYETASEVGLKPADLVDDSYRPCQALGERCRSDPAMPKALRVPSAALPGTPNLVVFGERLAIPYQARPLDQVDVPCSVLSEDGRPPRALLPLVRFVGQRHPELEAATHGLSFRFREPAVQRR